MTSCEADWVVLSKAIKESMFIMKLLQSMKFSVKLLLTERVENVEEIYMAENITATSHTKHVDIRYKYVNEYVECDSENCSCEIS